MGTIAQLCQAISSQLRHVSTIGKKLVKQRYVLHMSPQYGELRPTSGWNRFTSLGYPYKFPLVLRLGSVNAWHLVVGVSQTLRRWTEDATYIRQGDHHVGHWPTLLVVLVWAIIMSPTWPFTYWRCRCAMASPTRVSRPRRSARRRSMTSRVTWRWRHAGWATSLIELTACRHWHNSSSAAARWTPSPR